ncbi:MAG: SufD family Fe-S cluster assembly protein, partial [Cyanobacteria bacterium J06635_10]
ITQPRCLVVAKKGSEVTLVEEFINSESAKKEQQEVYLNNTVTEIWVEENAGVNHTRIERDSIEAFHIGKTAVTQARNSRYTCNAISLGGKLSRHNLEILQTGEQTETILNGLSIISGNQLADTHSALAL